MGVTAASAATPGAVGAGISIYPAGYGEVWLGGHTPPASGDAFLYCTQARVYTSAGDTPVSTDYMGNDAPLAWVIGVYGNSGDNNTQAAIAYLVHERHEEPGSMAGGNVATVKQLISDATPAAVKSLADDLIAAGASQAGPYTAVGGSVDTTTMRTGSVKDIGLKSASGQWVAGNPFTLTINGPAVFDATGTNTVSGTTAATGLTYTWIATGNGAVTYQIVVGNLGRTTFTHYDMGGSAQSGLSYGNRLISFDPTETSSPTSSFDVVQDFQPVVSSQVPSTYLSKGQAVADQVTVQVAAGDQWPVVNGSPIPLLVRGTLYGPFNGVQPTSATVPAGAPVAASETVAFTGAGTKAAGSEVASASGTYAWVWEVLKADQGTNSQYVRADTSDAFFASTEATTVRMTPQLSTQVETRIVDAAGAPLNDKVSVGLAGGDQWPADTAGNPLPLVARDTLYGPFNTPTAAAAATPGTAPVAGTQLLTFTAAGTKTTPATITRAAAGGFYTWRAEILSADQSAAMAADLAGEVHDQFMLEPETTSARDNLTHSSQVREYNVAMGGRAFDTITLSGFPADHGSFTGLSGWQADVATATVTTYGPFLAGVSAATLPANPPVLTSTTIPAKNGTYNIGYTAGDLINPNLAGHYVVVYSFAGDDRVAPFTSRANDVLEQFYVPAVGAAWVAVVSTATQDVTAGQGQMSDTALVLGSAVPAGSTLTWYRCTWTVPSAPGCATPVATYSTPVNGDGAFIHPPVDVPGVGQFPAGALTMYVGWAPVLTDAGGVTLAREAWGVAAQTTTVHAPIPVMTSQATTTAGPGAQVGDQVTLAGPTRSDWTVTWSACWLDGQGACPAGGAFAIGDPVHVDPAVATVDSPQWTVAVPAGTAPGTPLHLGWAPVLTDRVGAELAREPWGVAAQTTTVDYPLPTTTSHATVTGLVGQTSKDTLTVTGPVLAGTVLTWTGCYWISADHGGDTACRPDATPVAPGPVDSAGHVGVVLGALAPGQTREVTGPVHTLTAGGLLPDPGLRFSWMPVLTAPSGAQLVAEKFGVQAQTTVVSFPPITAATEAYASSTDGPWYGDVIGDRVTTTGDPFGGDTVTVRLYSWATGTNPVCQGEPLAQAVIKPMASSSTYDTGAIYTTPADATNLTYGFQETTTSRGTSVVSTCGLPAETLTPKAVPHAAANGGAGAGAAAAALGLAATGSSGDGALALIALGLVTVGALALYGKRIRQTAPTKRASR